MPKDKREKFYPATGKIVDSRQRRVHKFCEAVESAMADSRLSRCEALGCLAIIIAREANAEPDPLQAVTLPDIGEGIAVEWREAG